MFRIAFHIFPFRPENGFQYHNFILYVCFNLALFNDALKYSILYYVVDNELEILYKDPVVTLFESRSGQFM
jgi:predicted P-loop ATPase/GTPase